MLKALNYPLLVLGAALLLLGFVGAFSESENNLSAAVFGTIGFWVLFRAIGNLARGAEFGDESSQFQSAVVVLAWFWFLGVGLALVGFCVWIPTANPISLMVVRAGALLLVLTTLGAFVAIPVVGTARMWKRSKKDD